MLACNLPLWSVYAVTVEWIATISLLNCPTLFYCCFHWCSQYHKHFYRGGGGGNHEVVGKTTQKPQQRHPGQLSAPIPT